MIKKQIADPLKLDPPQENIRLLVYLSAGEVRSLTPLWGTVADIENLSPMKHTILFSQTTKYHSDYNKIVLAFEKKRIKEKALDYPFEVVESICKYVMERDAQLIDFISDKDVLIFVSSSKSSNGKYLFQVGKKNIKKAYFISSPKEIERSWFKSVQRVGISGATSTPLWLLEDTYAFLKDILK